MTTAPVRTRFAPAPTGYLHLGSARSALFNWLFARQQGGELLLRIEDTDTERSRPELIDVVYDVLGWLGIDWDGEPVLQSTRTEMYLSAVDDLVAAGAAYWCDCTPEDVKARAEARGGRPGYDSHCRERGLSSGPGRVVRFAVPDDGTTGWDDVVRGPIEFANAEIEDFVILRSNGTPMFLVANAVDDVDMGITHIIRGEDLINVTPKVLLLRAALGHHDQPVFAHLPLIVNEQRKKLSKRRDDVSVADYRDRGVLAEAMANYLATLGWGPPDGVEIRPMAEIIERFRLADVTSASAFFDVRKLEHFNGEWIRSLAVDDFVDRCAPWLVLPAATWAPEQFDADAFARMAPLVQERVKLLSEVPTYVDWLFTDAAPLDEDSWAKTMTKRSDEAAAVLAAVAEAFASCEWSAEGLGETVFTAAAEVGVTSRKRAQAPVRVAVLGRSVGPPLWESLEVLGRDATLERIAVARRRLADEVETAG
ncbi:MAG: glutamate--tRNA ligase [Acidimicrobiia bacterium]|nr:glutamate--tRNA ligase [Acidimicrobiia bacterium]